MIVPYNVLISYAESNWKEYLEEHSLLSVFNDLVAEYGSDNPLLTKLIRYIVWAYSLDSEKIVLGADWLQNKAEIFNSSGLPETLWDSVALLKNETIIKAIHGWLRYQEQDVFTQLVVLKDLLIEMQLSANSLIKRGTDIDYDQKFKNARYALELRDMIQKLETQLLQNHPKLKAGIKEVHFVSAKSTVGVETFAK